MKKINITIDTVKTPEQIIKTKVSYCGELLITVLKKGTLEPIQNCKLTFIAGGIFKSHQIRKELFTNKEGLVNCRSLPYRSNASICIDEFMVVSGDLEKFSGNITVEI